MNDHIDFPQPCDECTEFVKARARSLKQHHFGHACAHRGVFALVSVVDGVIVEWDLRGPRLTANEMLDALNLVRQAARRARIPVNIRGTN